jgi:WD40 repeat protein/predicted Ser/Thr protein kinase
MKLNDRPCPECGRPVPADAPEEVCPDCSLQSLLKFISDTAQSEGSSSKAVERSTLNPQPGVRFGDYKLLELLARGGMGVVYKARQVSLNRTVALKMIQSGLLASPAEVKRFQAEAEAIAHLQHPNIVAVHEVGEHEGRHYFSMDYVAGRTLAEVVRDGPLPATRAATYVKATAAAVDYAHHQGVLHRDLKPANVMIDENDQPRITDFGLAKRLADSPLSTLNPRLTLSGQVLGSPNYLPPEQAEPKHGALGPPSDVYALGAILYHLITARPPFQAESLTTLLRQVIETDPVAPRMLNPGLPRDLETICLKCLEKEPHRRYATARALADDLSRFLRGDAILARPVSTPTKAWKWCRARPALSGLSATLVLTLVTGVTTILLQLERTRAGQQAAQANAYAADMNLAQAAVASEDIGAALNLLKAHQLVPGQPDLRGWEWRYLWQRCRSEEEFQLASSNRAERVVFSPDSRWLAVLDQNGALTLWDPSRRAPRMSFKVAGYAKPFAFSPGGELLAYATAGDTVSVANLDRGQEIARFQQLTNLAHLAFSADATRVLSLGQDGSLMQWDCRLQQRLVYFQTPAADFTGEAKTAAFSRDGSMLGYFVANGIGIWDVNSGDSVRAEIEATPTALSLSADGKLLAAGIGRSQSEVWVWEVEELRRSSGGKPPPHKKFGTHRDWICGLAFSPDGRALVSASADSSLRIWHLEEPGTGRRLQGHTHQVLSVTWAPDGQYIASSGRDGSVRIWNPRRNPSSSEPRVLHISSLNWSFRLSSDGKRGVVVEPADGAVVLWDIEKERTIETLTFAGTNNYEVGWSPGEQMLAVGDLYGNLRVWDMSRRQPVASLRMPGIIGFLTFSPDGRFLSCGSATGTDTKKRVARFWQVDGWREIPVPPKAVEGFTWVALSPDSRYLASLHYGGALDLWDLRTGRCRGLSQPLVSPLEEGFVAFASDGQTWASTTKNGVLALWDTAGRRPPTFVPQTAQELWNISFSSDCTRLVVSGQRAADVVRLLDLRTKRFVASLSGEADVYWACQMLPDNNTVYAVGLKTVLLWRAPSWAEIEAAEKAGTAR